MNPFNWAFWKHIILVLRSSTSSFITLRIRFNLIFIQFYLLTLVRKQVSWGQLSLRFANIWIILISAIAQVYKTEGNDYFTKKSFSDAIYCYTEGIKVNCKDEELKAKLYGNRATANFNLGKKIHSSVNPLTHPSIHSHTQTHTPTHPLIHPSIQPSTHSSIHSFIHPSIHPLIHSFIHSFIRSFIHSFIHSFIQSITHSLTHSLIHSFIHLLIN